MHAYEFDSQFGGRMGRGMMEPVILHALEQKPMHGYEIISTLETQSHGMWRPSPGSVYPTLQLLEEKGHVTSDESDGKKVYSLTNEGRQAAGQTEAPFEHWGDPRPSLKEMKAMRETIRDMMHDMRTIHRRGTDQQRQRMLSAIERLRTELHNLVEEQR